MRWTKDPKVEANLRAKGIQFETATVPLSKIDLDEGLRRQTRFINKLNEDQVLTMAIDMGKPDAAFPMSILQKPPHNAPMWVWSGNHRLAAFSMAFPEATHIDAYLITIKDLVMLDLLPRIVNTWESQIGYSKEEKIANALWMVDKHNMTRQEAALEFGLKLNWLHVANQETQTREAVADIPKSERIPKSILRKLHPLMDNTNVLRSTVRLFTQHDVKSDDAKAVIEDVRAQTTEAQMMGEIGKWERIFTERKEPKKRVKGTVVMSRAVRDSFMTAITRLAKILDGNDTRAKLQITDPADQAVTLKAWNTIKSVMTKIEQER